MSQNKISLSKTDVSVVAPKKKPYTMQDFVNSFNSLDPQNMGNWPIPVKITTLIFVLLLTLFVAYLLLISPVLDTIKGSRAQEVTLLQEFKEKDSKLRNLELYQKQIEQMEETFGQLLRQLPKEHEIPSLIEDINYTGVSSGLTFKDIKVEKEVSQEFFIELPITIISKGDYHSFGAFISGLAALPRIVTVHDFEVKPLTPSENKSEIPILTIQLQARTYRYADPASEGQTGDQAQAANAAAKGGAKS
jgi:type IV pilus assembly protein PilO